MPWSLIACLAMSMSENSGLAPKASCSSASSVQTPMIAASPVKVVRRPASLATADAASHRNGR